MKQQVKQKHFRYGGVDYPYELHIGGVKRLNLRIRADGSLRVSVPRRTSQRRIDAFLTSCGDKIAGAVARIQAGQFNNMPKPSVTEQEQRKESLLAIIQGCHVNVVMPRIAALRLSMTDEQRRFIESPVAIRIHPMKTRWGSCNFKKGTLNFNLYLIDQPMECIEYVIMHEFAHFLIHDHSPAYHTLMTALMPDWKERKKRLNM